MKNYYQILGVSKKSSDQEIKTVYRKLAHQWHPDKNKSKEAQSKFIEIHEAYEFLIDPVKRKLFDEMYNTETSVVIRTQTEEQKTKQEEQKARYENFEKEAKFKAEYFSKVSFDKFATDILSGIDQVGKGCQTIFAFIAAVFFACMAFYGIYGIFQVPGNYQGDPWWQITLAILGLIALSTLFGFLAYRIFKGLFIGYDE